MQPVRGGEIACAPRPGPHRRRILADVADVVLLYPHTGGHDRVEQCTVQHRSTYAVPAAALERCVDVPGGVAVADAPERPSVRVHPQTVQMPQGVRHQALTAGLIDHTGAPLDDDHLQAGPGAVQRSRQAGRTASDDEQVDHDRLASAAFSTRIRVLSRTALKTENSSAVSHAVCTKGSAKPSVMTAT